MECDGKILLVRHLEGKSSDKAGKWGMPGGKVDPGESSIQGMVRELEEETGIAVSEEDLKFGESLKVRWERGDILYDTYTLKLESMPEVVLSDSEHDSFMWIHPEEVPNYNVIEDVDQCIQLKYASI